MKHSVEVAVSKEPINNSVVSCKEMSIGLRLYNKLFGSRGKMTVIILGKTIQNITIKEEE